MKVVLQGRQNIKLVSKALKNDGKNSYTISSDNFNQPIKISVLGGAKYSCAVSNSGKTAAWYESGKGLMVRGQGKVVVTVTTKTSADQVYLASKRVFTINLTGKVQNSDWVFKQDSDGKVILMKYTGKAVNVIYYILCLTIWKDTKLIFHKKLHPIPVFLLFSQVRIHNFRP